MRESPLPPVSLDVLHQRWTRILRRRARHATLPEMFADADDREAARHVAAIADEAVNSMFTPAAGPSGSGARILVAPFATLGQPSRFSDGSFGVFYAALDNETAIAETVFHAERQLRATNEDAIDFDMDSYVGEVVRPLEDVRGTPFAHLHQPNLDTWPVCQAFASERRAAGARGLWYPSDRRPGGECIGAFQPQAVSVPTRDRHYRYCWNGSVINRVLTISEVRDFSATHRVA